MTEKYYCGQNIEDLLAEVGFPIRDYRLQGLGVLIREKVSLYEAQKWLREEKEVYVTVIPEYNEFCSIKGVKYRLEVAHWKDDEFGYETIEWLDKEEPHTVITFDSHEEALSEGIKEAVKILKEKQDEKVFVIQEEHLDNIIPCQYDSDTISGMPNFLKGNYVVNVGKKEYLGYIYDEFIKVPEDGDYCYDFVLVNNGKVIAMGDEQGRCGGVTYSCKNSNFVEMLKSSPVYDKVKHLPVATSEELEEPIYKYFDNYQEYEEFLKSGGDGNK